MAMLRWGVLSAALVGCTVCHAVVDSLPRPPPDNSGSTTTPYLVSVGVRIPQNQADEIERLVWAVSDVDHPQYGKFLTREEIRHLRAASPRELNEVVQWLRASGCTPATVVPALDAVEAQCPSKPMAAANSRMDELVDYVYARRISSQTQRTQNQDDAIPTPTPTPTLNEDPLTTSTGTNRHGGELEANHPCAVPNNGTPARQRAFYTLPQTQRGSNSSNLQMVWGCGTFGVNLKGVYLCVCVSYPSTSLLQRA